MDLFFNTKKKIYFFGCRFNKFRNGRDMDQFEYDTIEELTEIGMFFCKQVWHLVEDELFLIIELDSVKKDSDLDRLVNKEKELVKSC